ncbi:MAG: RibD family protein [Beijerinckiaceae bacterium]|jgi:diaminohydroxyphosphoribosylaminopyrimidine deaminase / 5-amino-6-(5-phosphoribosylamino)uracil reductase|nr:RibD family protein [Beijerinckiaceae bacterium]MDO9441357.1 RibD family protein [Beijerinckiaceae bacterium]
MSVSKERGATHDLASALPLPATDAFAAFRAADPTRPFVVAQLGQSLDGRIATVSGESRYINGAPALDHLHHMRAHVDAVVVGASTVVADDPQLTVRRVPGKSPARVVIDPSGRLKGPAKWHEQNGARCIVISACEGDDIPGIERIRIDKHDGVIPPRLIVEALFRRGFSRLLIEGGARTISAFIDADCVDRLHLLIAPLIIGSGRTGLDLHPVPELDKALRPSTCVYSLGGGEFLFDCDLREARTGA